MCAGLSKYCKITKSYSKSNLILWISDPTWFAWWGCCWVWWWFAGCGGYAPPLYAPPVAAAASSFNALRWFSAKAIWNRASGSHTNLYTYRSPEAKNRTHGILYGFNSTLFIVLTSNFLHDPLFVVISEWSAELVVVHGRAVLLDAPPTCNLHNIQYIMTLSIWTKDHRQKFFIPLQAQ